MLGGYSFKNCIADRHVSTKVALGFSAVLAILAVSSAVGYVAFNGVASSVATYSSTVDRTDLFQDIDRGMVEVRALTREFLFSGDEATGAASSKAVTALRETIGRAKAAVHDVELQRLVDDLQAKVGLFSESLDKLRSNVHELGAVETGVLDTAGEQMTDGVTTTIAALIKANNDDLLPAAIEARRLSLIARLDVNKRIGRNSEAAGVTAKQDFADLKRALGQLATGAKDTDLGAVVSRTASIAGSYQGGFEKAVELLGQRASIATSLAATREAMIADAGKARDALTAQSSSVRQDMLAGIASNRSLVLFLGLAGLVVGSGLAWIIGRGIARPIVAMCGAMRALAGGDKSVTIPGVGRKDEIGQMAGTVQVFKDSMIETERLREENERQKAQAEAERKSSMLRLADNFETGIKGVVNSVASQSTEMQSAAQAMTHTAEMATQQATAVAASVEQASANVQTVATAAEELSASVLEIGRQVDQSSKIASQAVSEADRTNTTVEGLNHSAQPSARSCS